MRLPLRIATVGLSGVMLSACIGSEVIVPLTNRFSIDSYQALQTPQADLTGKWMMVLSATREEDVDGTQVNANGFTREVLTITDDGAGGYELRTCVEPHIMRPVTVDGNNLTFVLNGVNADFNATDNVTMAGTMTFQTDTVNYNGTAQLKKIADLDKTFGTFETHSETDGVQQFDASCFHEDDLAGNATKLFVTFTSEMSVVNVSNWDDQGNYRRNLTLKKTGGNLEIHDSVRIYSGSMGVDPTVTDYIADQYSITINQPTLNVAGITSQVTVGGDTNFQLTYQISQ